MIALGWARLCPIRNDLVKVCRGIPAFSVTCTWAVCGAFTSAPRCYLRVLTTPLHEDAWTWPWTCIVLLRLSSQRSPCPFVMKIANINANREANYNDSFSHQQYKVRQSCFVYNSALSTLFQTILKQILDLSLPFRKYFNLYLYKIMPL